MSSSKPTGRRISLSRNGFVIAPWKNSPTASPTSRFLSQDDPDVASPDVPMMPWSLSDYTGRPISPFGVRRHRIDEGEVDESRRPGRDSLEATLGGRFKSADHPEQAGLPFAPARALRYNRGSKRAAKVLRDDHLGHALEPAKRRDSSVSGRVQKRSHDPWRHPVRGPKLRVRRKRRPSVRAPDRAP